MNNEQSVEISNELAHEIASKGRVCATKEHNIKLKNQHDELCAISNVIFEHKKEIYVLTFANHKLASMNNKNSWGSKIVDSELANIFRTMNNCKIITK